MNKKKIFGNKIGNNILWLFLDKVFRMGIGLFISVWLARYLGPENQGILDYSLSICALFASITWLGLKSILIRELTALKNEQNLLLGTSALMMLVSAIVVYISLLCFNYYIHFEDDKLVYYLIIIIGAGGLFRFTDIVVYLFESRVESKVVVIVSNSVVFFSFALKILFIVFKLPLFYFGIVIFLEGFIRGVLLLSLYIYKEGNITWSFSKEKAKNLLKDSYPFMLSSVMVMLYMRVDQIMLKELLGEAEVGHYSIVLRLTEIMFFLPTIIQSTFLPKLVANFREKNVEEYNLLFSKLIIGLTFSMFIVALFVSIIAPQAIQLLYGKVYEPSGQLLRLHIWLLIPISISMIRSIEIIVKNYTKVHLWITISGFLLNLALNLILIPRYGIIGASIASLSSYFYVGYFSNFIFTELKGVSKIINNSFLRTGYFLKLIYSDINALIK